MKKSETGDVGISHGRWHRKLLHILFIEDSPAAVRLTQETLKEILLRTQITVVEDGEKALAFLRHDGEYAQAPRPDVIFLNFDLPGVDGCQLLEEITNDAELRAIPVVTFSSSNYTKDHLIAAGLVVLYLTKSLRRAQFLKLLKKLLRRM